MKKTLCMLCTLLFLLSVHVSAEGETTEELIPDINPDSALRPVENLRFAARYNDKGERRLRLSWDGQAEADSYYILYSFEVGGKAYPNSKIVEQEKTYFEPTVLGSGRHLFRVYPLRKNRTCPGVSSVEVYVAGSDFFPSLLPESRSVDYYASADVELGLERFSRIVKEEKLLELDEFQKVRKIHRVLCDMLTYSDEESDVFRAIIAGRGLCDAYARGFKILCDLSGLECEYIVGRAGDGTSDFESHAWNMVRLHGEYYNVDVTWDDIGQNYLYFLLPDAEFVKTHLAETTPRPEANSTKYMLSGGAFSQSTLTLSPEEEGTVTLVMNPKEASFRAKLMIENEEVAGYTVSEETVRITARNTGTTVMEVTDGARVFDTLRIEVRTKPGQILRQEPEPQAPTGVRLALWLTLLAAAGGYLIYYAIQKNKKK